MPAGQDAQTAAPPSEKVPASHVKQRVMPAAGWNVPAAQLTHALAPAEAYVPESQLLQPAAVEPGAEANVPAAHAFVMPTAWPTPHQ